MKRIFTMLFLGLIGFGVFVNAQIRFRIDGVYEFVSQEVVTTKSNDSNNGPTVERISSPDWSGIWHFQDGEFSTTLMRAGRHVPFDCAKEMGFEAVAGTYVISKEEIVLKQHLSLNPLYMGRIIRMNYLINGKTLKLSGKILPGPEDLREGEFAILLKKK